MRFVFGIALVVCFISSGLAQTTNYLPDDIKNWSQNRSDDFQSKCRGHGAHDTPDGYCYCYGSSTFIDATKGGCPGGTTSNPGPRDGECCGRSTDPVKAQANILGDLTCAAELKSLKCDDFFKDIPKDEVGLIARRCDGREPQFNSTELITQCIKQLPMPIIDGVRELYHVAATGVANMGEAYKRLTELCEKNPDLHQALNEEVYPSSQKLNPCNNPLANEPRVHKPHPF
jgi:hypothetical protein